MLLNWIAAVGGIAATVGTWMGPVRSRWNLHAERLRAEPQRRAAELHKQRFCEVWSWAHSQPPGPEQARAWRWYDWWIGDPPGGSPGTHAADTEDAYRQYVDWLEVCYGKDSRWSPRRDWPRLPDGEPPLSWLDLQNGDQAAAAAAAADTDRADPG